MASTEEGRDEDARTFTASRLRRRSMFLRWSGVVVASGLLVAALLSLPYQMFAVRTGSMEPTFGPRAMVLVHTGEFHKGQPISFVHNGEVITHRLVSVNADGTGATQGDANRTPDPWIVQRSDIIGEVVTSVPLLGYWLVYLKTAAGAGSLAFALMAIALIWTFTSELDDTRRPSATRTRSVKHHDLAGADG